MIVSEIFLAKAAAAGAPMSQPSGGQTGAPLQISVGGGSKPPAGNAPFTLVHPVHGANVGATPLDAKAQQQELQKAQDAQVKAEQQAMDTQRASQEQAFETELKARSEADKVRRDAYMTAEKERADALKEVHKAKSDAAREVSKQVSGLWQEAHDRVTTAEQKLRERDDRDTELVRNRVSEMRNRLKRAASDALWDLNTGAQYLEGSSGKGKVDPPNMGGYIFPEPRSFMGSLERKFLRPALQGRMLASRPMRPFGIFRDASSPWAQPYVAEWQRLSEQFPGSGVPGNLGLIANWIGSKAKDWLGMSGQTASSIGGALTAAGQGITGENPIVFPGTP